MKNKQAIKSSLKRPSLRKRSKGGAGTGTMYVIVILGIVTVFGGVLSGGLFPDIAALNAPPPPGPAYTCCDSGDGAACKASTEKVTTFNGKQYGLLKTNVVQHEAMHMAPTNESTSDGYRIFVNSSDSFDAAKKHGSILPGSDCSLGKDYIALNDPSIPDKEPYYGGYFCVPNDELIYVCKDTIEACNQTIREDTTPFDVYYRLEDGPIDTRISTKCPKPSAGADYGKQKVVAVPTAGGRKNLQLETFTVQQDETTNPWLGAWCKPAIYLYPEQTEQVNVAVAPKGEFKLTIPDYPAGGWNVTAHPNGDILYKDKTYPYLYWEASLPDSLLTQPKDGYVVRPSELKDLFGRVLPQTGLNAKEAKEFSDYWLKALPESNYYFVGVMPQSQIDSLAPLTVSPQPDSILRVSLYFKALDEKVAVNEPQLSGFNRHGFTVTEWGGLFKADKRHAGFTCMM